MKAVFAEHHGVIYRSIGKARETSGFAIDFERFDKRSWFRKQALDDSRGGVVLSKIMISGEVLPLIINDLLSTLSLERHGAEIEHHVHITSPKPLTGPLS